MKIKKVAVLGAGAVGSYVIWGLSSRNDIELGVIAEGERAERLKQNGCTINGKNIPSRSMEPQRNRRCRFTDCCIEVWLTFGGIGKYSESNLGEYDNYESDERGRQ